MFLVVGPGLRNGPCYDPTRGTLNDFTDIAEMMQEVDSGMAATFNYALNDVPPELQNYLDGASPYADAAPKVRTLNRPCVPTPQHTAQRNTTC